MLIFDSWMISMIRFSSYGGGKPVWEKDNSEFK